MKLQHELQLLRKAAQSFDAVQEHGDCLALVRSGNPYDVMFFSQLSDARWLPLLRAANVFQKLPKKVVHGDMTYYPRAVPLIGLAKLAPVAPADVVSTLEALEIPNNPQIHDQVMRVVRAIDDLSLAVRLVPILQRLFESRSTSEWLWLDDILVKWLSGNAHQACFDALAAFLQSIARDTREHGAHQVWQVAELDRKVISGLAAWNTTRLVEMLFSVLQTWANAERTKLEAREGESPRAASDPDFDYPWTYWLEEFGATAIGSHDFESTLAQRLYKIGRTIYEKREHEAIDHLDELLRGDRWHLFRRMRWQWYADSPSLTLRFARSEVLERIPRLKELSGIHRFEFASLLETHATEHGNAFLAPDEVREFTDAVFRGPIDENGNIDEEYRERFYRLQLYPIRTLLAGEALRRYDELSVQGEVRKDLYKPFSLGGGEAKVIEHVSPIDANHLAERNDVELWNFLNTWQPIGEGFNADKWWIEQHAGALGDEFAKLVEATPHRFRADTEWWRNIRRPEVLSKLVERATSRFEQTPEPIVDEMTPEWRTWFGVATWIVEQATDARETGELWNWPKIVVIKFLRAAIRCKGAAAETVRFQIGRLLRGLVTATDFGLNARETRQIDDWLTAAINSSRGTAVEALLELALAQKRTSDRGVPEPWIFELIAQRLRARDESPAVFAILGAHLRLATYLFGDSFRNEPELLMPNDRPDHLASFLVSHFLYDNPASQVIRALPTLPEVALTALSHLREGSTGQRRGDVASRLGTHLSFYYWNDLLGERPAANSLIDRYLEAAAPESRAETVGQIARIFGNAEATENQQLYERVTQLWDHWFRRIRESIDNKSQPPASFTAELGEFIQWLECNCFTFELRFKRALEAIAIIEKPPRAYGLIETLSEFAAQDRLEEAIVILHAIAVKGSDQIQWSYREEHLMPLLKRALTSGSRISVLLAESIQEQLLLAGLFEYLDLEKEIVEESLSV